MATFDFSKKGQVSNRTYVPGATTLTVCHRIDTRPVPFGTGPLAAADVLTLFDLPPGLPFRLLRQTSILRTKSTTEATLRTNAAQTPFAVGPAQAAVVPLAVDGAVATTVVQSLAGSKVEATVATGAITGGIIDVYTDIELYGPVI